MLDSSWGLILRVLPSLPFNIPNRRLCHFPRRTGSPTARERSPLRDLFVHVSLLQISPLDDPGQFFCLPGRWCLFRHLPVVVKFLLHCRHHKGCLASLSVTWETRFNFATWNKLLAQIVCWRTVEADDESFALYICGPFCLFRLSWDMSPSSHLLVFPVIP